MLLPFNNYYQTKIKEWNNSHIKRVRHNSPCGIRFFFFLFFFVFVFVFVFLLSTLVTLSWNWCFLWTAASAHVKLCNAKDFALTENPHHLSDTKTRFLNQ